MVVELKTVKFIPEFAGKLNFYVAAVDGLLKSGQDHPTIGILICKSKYELTRVLPDDLKPSLPSIEQIEAELGGET